jgi:putative ABC transport system permease protein
VGAFAADLIDAWKALSAAPVRLTASCDAAVIFAQAAAAGQDDDFAVTDPREIQALLQTVTGLLTTLLAAVAAVSLIVGGIGIMNIMLVSVTERTREVGIRSPSGRAPRTSSPSSSSRAVVLSALGGVIGIVAGLAAAFAIARGVAIPFVVPALATQFFYLAMPVTASNAMKR